MPPILVLKVGGAELADREALELFVQAAVAATRKAHLIIVHGGGPEIAATQQALGLEPRFADGLRITDDASLRVAEMVLSGLVNKRLAGALTIAGAPALGISGIDAGLLTAQRLTPQGQNIGWVGDIHSVKVGLLISLSSLGLIPVVSPISMDETGQHYNVNADSAALAIAQALSADELVFLTNVPGVLLNAQLLSTLDGTDIENLIAEGTISGGMIPKTRSAVQATRQGVACVRITNLEGLATDSGTRVVLHKVQEQA